MSSPVASSPTNPQNVPVADVRAHLAKLRAAGLAQPELARRARVGVATISAIESGTRLTCRASTAAAILEIEPPEHAFDQPLSRLIAATDATAQLRALCLLGWSPSALAEQLPSVSAGCVNRILAGRYRRIHVGRAREIDDLYKQLSTSAGPDKRAREAAERRAARGWTSRGDAGGDR